MAFLSIPVLSKADSYANLSTVPKYLNKAFASMVDLSPQKP